VIIITEEVNSTSGPQSGCSSCVPRRHEPGLPHDFGAFFGHYVIITSVTVCCCVHTSSAPHGRPGPTLIWYQFAMISMHFINLPRHRPWHNDEQWGGLPEWTPLGPAKQSPCSTEVRAEMQILISDYYISGRGSAVDGCRRGCTCRSAETCFIILEKHCIVS